MMNFICIKATNFGLIDQFYSYLTVYISQGTAIPPTKTAAANKQILKNERLAIAPMSLVKQWMCNNCMALKSTSSHANEANPITTAPAFSRTVTR